MHDVVCCGVVRWWSRCRAYFTFKKQIRIQPSRYNIAFYFHEPNHVNLQFIYHFCLLFFCKMCWKSNRTSRLQSIIKIPYRYVISWNRKTVLITNHDKMQFCYLILIFELIKKTFIARKEMEIKACIHVKYEKYLVF